LKLHSGIDELQGISGISRVPYHCINPYQSWIKSVKLVRLPLSTRLLVFFYTWSLVKRTSQFMSDYDYFVFEVCTISLHSTDIHIHI